MERVIIDMDEVIADPMGGYDRMVRKRKYGFTG